jgi:hypothetical protein
MSYILGTLFGLTLPLIGAIAQNVEISDDYPHIKKAQACLRSVLAYYKDAITFASSVNVVSSESKQQ